MHEFIEELRLYHRDKAQHLASLEHSIEEIVGEAARDRSIRVVQACFEPFRGDTEFAHHRNEELVLAELRRTPAPIHRRVEEISSDHQAFDRITTNIWTKITAQAADRDELASLIQHFISVYKDHASGEDAIFFPIADEYLQREHWNSIEKSWS